MQFVRLSAVSSSGGLVSAIAEALQFSFYGGDDPIVQLVEYLRPKCLLLLLDNFEHLLDGAELVATILRSAPGVKFLITSQERLNLQGEWLLELDGMSVPEGESLSTGDAARYGAVQLFVSCARRVDAGFSLRPQDLPGVLRICRLVGGTPLGIELAAAWLRAISIGEIAQEIERSLQFLSTRQRDMPERHRSLQAVFDHSWNRLPEAERRVFCRLSVFSGGFARDAAEHVAGASLADLSALMDKSLLRRLGTGRYAMHGLLRDFAQAKRASFRRPAAGIWSSSWAWLGRPKRACAAPINSSGRGGSTLSMTTCDAPCNGLWRRRARPAGDWRATWLAIGTCGAIGARGASGSPPCWRLLRPATTVLMKTTARDWRGLKP